MFSIFHLKGISLILKKKKNNHYFFNKQKNTYNPYFDFQFFKSKKKKLP